jgi:hypothetical protein
VRNEYMQVKPIASAIADAADNAMDAYREGRVGEEPHVTDRILGAIEDRLKSRRIGGLEWKAKTLRTSRGTAAEEKRHGADVLGVLNIDIPDFKTRKGFLAQAKLAEPGSRFSSDEWERLVEQCKLMLGRTPASFVFIYSKVEGVRVFPATGVVGLADRNIFALYNHGLGRFFEDFIECFIGDPRLDSPHIGTLDALADFHVKRALELVARKTQRANS